ncbi:unnamed protein product [Heligmosomoides polygyrus]|uniref:Uncharacterized protein n=1 Tax=Heligmosomoides polygyrus TaxID=6339 RepID=A0A183GXI2_HELPZ|nr:unnamed protein product [Heligmosomoides polygyrus]
MGPMFPCCVRLGPRQGSALRAQNQTRGRHTRVCAIHAAGVEAPFLAQGGVRAGFCALRAQNQARKGTKVCAIQAAGVEVLFVAQGESAEGFCSKSGEAHATGKMRKKCPEIA